MLHFLKKQLSRIPPSILERALALSLIHNRFHDLKKSRRFESREQMWLHTLSLAEPAPLRFLEFGVWQGYSINFFAKNSLDSDALFFGFDSFEGLPEDWTREQSRGAFSTGGVPPTALDQRVSFVSGWFDETLPCFLFKWSEILSQGTLIVHFDADLYSSTLFVLVSLDSLKREYYAIFDEFFSGHETRALNDYSVVYGAEITMISKTGGDFPAQIACLIRPKQFSHPT